MKKFFILTHRWMSIAGAVMLISWLLSGIVFTFRGMPSFSNEARLSLLFNVNNANPPISEGLIHPHPAHRGFAATDADAEIYAERAMCLAVAFDGFGILVNGSIGFGFVITLDE